VRITQQISAGGKKATDISRELRNEKVHDFLCIKDNFFFLSSIFVFYCIVTNLSFREAIALAKVRLSPIDPVLEDLYTLWAHQLTKDGNFEQAAKWLVQYQRIHYI
jgi:hypothetical protein